MLRELPGECRVQIGENPFAGYAHIHGFNALTGKDLHVLQLIAAEE